MRGESCSLQEALEASSSMVRATENLREFVRKHLASIELEVACCYLHMDMDHPVQASGSLLVVVSGLILAGVIVYIAGARGLSNVVKGLLPRMYSSLPKLFYRVLID